MWSITLYGHSHFCFESAGGKSKSEFSSYRGRVGQTRSWVERYPYLSHPSSLQPLSIWFWPARRPIETLGPDRFQQASDFIIGMVINRSQYTFMCFNNFGTCFQAVHGSVPDFHPLACVRGIPPCHVFTTLCAAKVQHRGVCRELCRG